ncbi:Alpha/Beta hydrolase protein [Globomyces pollinis-pini]|nr:Alpha/Beta hydrolase protein [Globomyces pollinis-pini]
MLLLNVILGIATASPVSVYPIFDPTLVQLDYGAFQGVQDQSSRSFLNIPFAAAPLGKLRFAPPQPPVTVNGTQDATKFGNGCIQNIRSGFLNGTGLTPSEDCLNLNVFVPKRAKRYSKLPVVVFIHGGGFDSGYSASAYYDGRNIIGNVADDVILVTFNYRVGVFGFLASNELASKGYLNAGLLDQVAVFKWVRKYIAKFGGDPTKVTAFGQSAGAISIGVHLTAQQGSNTLFDRAVLHSGGVPLIAMLPSQQQPTFNKIAAGVNCSNSTIGVIECLQNVDASVLYQTVSPLRIQFNPVIDFTYVNAQPISNLLAGKFQKIPLMVNNVADEGTWFTAPVVTNPAIIVPFEKQLLPFLNDQEFSQLQSLYPPASYNVAFQAAGDVFGDVGFQMPGFFTAEAYNAAGLTAIKSEFKHIPVKASDNLKALGVYHGSDLGFTWNYMAVLDSSELEFSKLIAQRWINFAKGIAVDSNCQNGTRVNLALNGSTVVPDIERVEKAKFWKAVIKRVFQIQ